MKRLILSVIVVAAVSLMVGGKDSSSDFALPTLHVIKDATLSPAYSCRSSEEFGKGNQSTALFLSDWSKHRNSPDLLFNGACKSEDYFEASTAGDDMSLIADLGANVPLETLSASRAFNLQQVSSFSAYSNFARAVRVAAGHTYAVLLNGRDKRGLFVFSVNEYAPNEKVTVSFSFHGVLR